ncbi:hypothetical protein CLOSTASPAR_00813 [[Clostridium] asparagiforme DSM 15981]|uniref:Uncharacterized protein n=1 Tax=[Clostridium] asparagiforme DSM 15981 TaxID=518636 RepID=C0CV12_9FIRM|nr:hypothetical protein CLOSTASPAR_00813 [[Clostridium] asparagiforme DSM 15981]
MLKKHQSICAATYGIIEQVQCQAEGEEIWLESPENCLRINKIGNGCAKYCRRFLL